LGLQGFVFGKWAFYIAEKRQAGEYHARLVELVGLAEVEAQKSILGDLIRVWHRVAVEIGRAKTTKTRLEGVKRELRKEHAENMQSQAQVNEHRFAALSRMLGGVQRSRTEVPQIKIDENQGAHGTPTCPTWPWSADTMPATSRGSYGCV
jgi:hypothetical protein